MAATSAVLLSLTPVSAYRHSLGSRSQGKCRAQRLLCRTSRTLKQVSTYRTPSGLSRRSYRVSCKADETEKKQTLSNLDSLLGIEEEAEVVAPRKENIEAPPSPPTTPSSPPPPVVQPKGNSEADIDVDISERIIASLCYMLPLMDGLKYSSYIIQQVPQFAILLLPLTPIIKGYYGLGFFTIIVFFGLYFGVAQNRSLPRFVRFNASQAIVLDIILILPDVLMSLFNGIDGPPTGGAALEAKILLNNTTFLYVYLCTLIASVGCLLGKAVELPLVGGAAQNQTRD